MRSLGNLQTLPVSAVNGISSCCEAEGDFSESINRKFGDEVDLKRCSNGNSTASELARKWSKRKMEQGIPEFKCFLSFLVGAPKIVLCGICRVGVFPEEKIVCSVRGCGGNFHLKCAEQCLQFDASKQFKCPQHACFLCSGKNQLWRCIRCPIAFHEKCAPFPEHVIHFSDQPEKAICWKHPIDWHCEEYDFPTHNTENIFPLLPLAYGEEEFKIDLNWKGKSDAKLELDPYVRIKRNVYLIKRSRKYIDDESGCTNCSSSGCSDGCVCFSLLVAQRLAHAPKLVQTDHFRKTKNSRLSGHNFVVGV